MLQLKKDVLTTFYFNMSLGKPNCIDFVLINVPLSFYKSKCLLTGLSDCQKLVPSVFKRTFSKSTPKKVVYKNFEKFIEKYFYVNLRGKVPTELIDNYSSFENVFIDVLNRYGPINMTPYVTKALRKAIMKRSQLEMIHYKKKNQNSFKKV